MCGSCYAIILNVQSLTPYSRGVITGLQGQRFLQQALVCSSLHSVPRRCHIGRPGAASLERSLLGFVHLF